MTASAPAMACSPTDNNGSAGGRRSIEFEGTWWIKQQRSLDREKGCSLSLFLHLLLPFCVQPGQAGGGGRASNVTFSLLLLDLGPPQRPRCRCRRAQWRPLCGPAGRRARPERRGPEHQSEWPTQGPLLLQPPHPSGQPSSALPALFSWLSLPSPRSVAISTCWPTPSTTSLMGWLWPPASW